MFVRRPSYHWSALWRITLNGRIMAQRALPGEVREAVWMGCDGAPQGGPTLRGVDCGMYIKGLWLSRGFLSRMAYPRLLVSWQRTGWGIAWPCRLEFPSVCCCASCVWMPG